MPKGFSNKTHCREIGKRLLIVRLKIINGMTHEQAKRTAEDLFKNKSICKEYEAMGREALKYIGTL